MILMWTQMLSVGIKSFDEDHRRLIHIVNELHAATKYLDADGNVEAEEIEIALHRLENYVKYHCLSEEKLMAKTRYPGYEAHKKEHDKLVDMLVDMNRRFKGSVSARDAEEIMEAMHEWVANHINVVDKGYTDFLNKAGIF